MSEGRLYLELITRRRCVFEGYVTKVILPSKLGELCILPDHAALLAVVIPGVFRSKDVKGNEIVYAVKGGFVQVQSNHVKVMVERAWNRDELADSRESDEQPWNSFEIFYEDADISQELESDQIREIERQKLIRREEETYFMRLLSEAKQKVKAGLKDG